jgi:LPXTG-motif cell wall-anchored protein
LRSQRQNDVKNAMPLTTLEHDVRVAPEAAERRPRGALEDGQPRAHPVDRQALVRPRDPLGAGVVARDHRDAVAVGDPARHLAVEDRAGPARLRMRPVAIRQDQDVTPGRHAGATVPSRVMPSPVRIGVLVAILALLVPAAAVAQSGGDGGAGDSQYQDPFGSQTQAKPSTPKPAQQQQTSPRPTPDHSAPAPAATAPAAQAATTPTRAPAPAQLPRTGFDVIPVAAAGVLLLLGGLALSRRPHGER